MRCVDCATVYPIRNGIPNLLSAELLEAYKQQEMQGWVKLWEKKGMYARPTLEDSFQLPYLGGIWVEVARMFDLAVDAMHLKGHEAILEIGAGQGWAARRFAARGCQVVAMDIVDDEWYGLGRSWAIMERAGVYFEPVLADGEHLPFYPSTFDIVFLCGALHHFRRFGKLLRQAYRVLRPGGRLVATGEPSVAIIVRERAAQAQLEEPEQGIVERRPYVFEYAWEIRRAGFGHVHVDVYDTYGSPRARVYDWMLAVRANLSQAVRRRYRPFVWLVMSLVLRLPHSWARTLALWANGGNLLLRATKPS